MGYSYKQQKKFAVDRMKAVEELQMPGVSLTKEQFALWSHMEEMGMSPYTEDEN